MNHPYTIIGVRGIIILLMMVFVAIIAMFRSDSIGTTFAMTGVQLQIDSYATYNEVVQPNQTWALKDLVPGVDKFFDFNDVLPGDRGVTTISLHTDEDAWACMDFTNLTDLDNSTNEPEASEDPDGVAAGELSKGMEFFGWIDDGDNTFEVGEAILFGDASPQAAFDVLKQYILADTSTGSFFPANQTKYVAISWCAGDLIVDTNTGDISCDGSALGNIAQSDSFSVDLGLRVVATDNHTQFRCDDKPPTVLLQMDKHISGGSEGFVPSDFSYLVTGDDFEAIVPHGSSTPLELGTYYIEELVPEGFVKTDWRIGWYGECDPGSTFITSITIDGSNIDHGWLDCQADNQYRPAHGDNQPSDADTEDDITQLDPPETVPPVDTPTPRLERPDRDVTRPTRTR